jgi:hypothetical protein
MRTFLIKAGNAPLPAARPPAKKYWQKHEGYSVISGPLLLSVSDA